ncbi:hypothetical protein Q8G41_28740, partial [Klebsiella pneumoniae]|uniref:hypothetical protein n=1 Tax=Klebsiella pneumoniae TaxID=573 RepID=UPI00301386BC
MLRAAKAVLAVVLSAALAAPAEAQVRAAASALGAGAARVAPVALGSLGAAPGLTAAALAPA